MAQDRPLKEGAEKKEGCNKKGREVKTMDAFIKKKGAFRIHNAQTQEKEENMKGQGIDFINFIIDALQDEPLMDDALKKTTPKELYDFFQAKGYRDVPFKDCADILRASQAVHGKGVDEGGDPVVVPVQQRPPGY